MDNSGLNTVLLVMIALALVGGAVWFFTSKGTPQEKDNGVTNIEVSLPTGGDNGSDQPQQ